MIPLVELGGDPAALARACREVGAFQLRLPPERAARVRATLDAARAFFALPPDDKRALDIAGSPHHRGFSEMHNPRDWREQLHLGREEPCGKTPHDGRPDHQWLVGPNRWPARLGEPFRRLMLDHLHAAAELGRALLAALAPSTGISPSLASPSSYLVMKLICYHPQPDGEARRAGVAPHVDYSLLTLLAEDALGGLEVQLADGAWHEVEPRSDALLVNVGEIVEAATGGELRATPHRVVNASTDRERLSIPVFLNPPLDATVEPRPRGAAATVDSAHVHRVLPSSALDPFVYGDGEWRRKGHNVWCHDCCK